MHMVQAQRRVLTATQARTLVYTYRTGAVPSRCRWTTIHALMITGMLEDKPQGYGVTAQGEVYCTAHNSDRRAPSNA